MLLFSRITIMGPYKALIESPIFTNTPCKPTCLYNAPSLVFTMPLVCTLLSTCALCSEKGLPSNVLKRAQNFCDSQARKDCHVRAFESLSALGAHLKGRTTVHATLRRALRRGFFLQRGFSEVSLEGVLYCVFNGRQVLRRGA